MRHITLAVALSLVSVFASADEQSRTTAPFKSIDLKGPISIVVEAGKAHSLRVSGNQEFIGGVVTEVVHGELRVHMREKGVTKISGDPRVIVTMPELNKFAVEGAGEAKLNNIRGQALDVSYKGAGRLGINGKVTRLDLKAQGVGEVDTKALIAEDASVDFEGVGRVHVYARGKLDATVKGIGELVYYGNPRTFNKTVAGIGSVKAGD